MPLFNPDTLREATEGFQEFSARFAKIAGEEPDALQSNLRFIKSIPAEDKAKKRELARFFQSDAGNRYNKEQRRAAYNELLGASRNRDFIG